MKLTREQCFARAEALLEAAEHLLQNWTLVPAEVEAGLWAAQKLQKMSEEWHEKAACVATGERE